MGPIGWPEIFVLVFMLLLPAALIVGIVLIATGGRKGAAGEMACAGCGYSVRGLEQLHCPECGADLRAVGITSGGSAGRRTLGIVLVAISALLLVSCCGLGAVGFLWVGASAPVHQQPLNPTTIQSQQAPSPALHDQVEEAVEIREGDPVDVDETVSE